LCRERSGCRDGIETVSRDSDRRPRNDRRERFPATVEDEPPPALTSREILKTIDRAKLIFLATDRIPGERKEILGNRHFLATR
jgi:hypothetical protein